MSGSGSSSGSGSPQQQQPGRFSEFIRSIPLVTLVTMIVCTLIYILGSLEVGSLGSLGLYAISPAWVFEMGQWWRIITAAFFHGGLMHIAMNMMSLWQLGTGLESMFGTLQFAFVTSWYVVLVGLLYICIGALAGLADKTYYFQSAVGYSGVLFAMAVDEASLSPFPTRSIFGLFNVPTKLYPWVLMLILQLLLPNVSLLGHLCGILVGMAHSRNWLSWLYPSTATAARWEQKRWMQWVVRMPSYKLAPASPVLPSPAGLGETLREAGSMLACAFAPCMGCLRGAAAVLPRMPRWGRGGQAGGAAAGAPAASNRGGGAVGSSAATSGGGAAATRLPPPSSSSSSSLPASALDEEECDLSAGAGGQGWMSSAAATVGGFGGLGGGGGGRGGASAYAPLSTEDLDSRLSSSSGIGASAMAPSAPPVSPPTSFTASAASGGAGAGAQAGKPVSAKQDQQQSEKAAKLAAAAAARMQQQQQGTPKGAGSSRQL